MNDQIALIFTTFLYILIIAIVIRSLMSWFPMSRDNPFARVVHQLTEPLLEPVRSVMPRTGIIDLSAMVVIIVLYVMVSVVNRAANA